MSSHIYHPDLYVYGLEPTCPRCQEHAEHPELLEHDLRLRIVQEPLSELDLVARRRLFQIALPEVFQGPVW